MFRFLESRFGHIGIERERFLVDPNGKLVPRADEFLKEMQSQNWSPELSACQVEDKTEPSDTLQGIWSELRNNDQAGFMMANKLGFKLMVQPVAPQDMPLDVYPTPRYQKIAKNVSVDKLSAACRVTGLHIHVGMPNWVEAIRVYNSLRDNFDFLCRVGDRSGGERLRLYKVMAKNWRPPEIKDPGHFFQIAELEGFDQNPRNCYWLIRISSYGTVELRMFDMIENLFEILGIILAVQVLLDRGRP